MTPQQLNILGLSLNILGSLIVALCLSKYFTWITLSIGVTEMNQDPSSDTKVTGHSRHVDRIHKAGSAWTWIGVILLVLGFVCQLLAALKM